MSKPVILRGKLFARICSKTGQPFNEGFYLELLDIYLKDCDKLLVKVLRENAEYLGLNKAAFQTDSEVINESYNKGIHYYSEWEPETDYCYCLTECGQIIHIED